MSSRQSTPVDSDDEMMNAMAQETPTVLRTGAGLKRTYAAMTGDDNTGSDNEHGAASLLPFVAALPNQNVVATAKHYADKQRIRGEQVTELDVFLKDPALLREAKLLINMFALRNHFDKIIASNPGFELSPDLEMNIMKYAPAIILSDKISTYKGEGPKTALLVNLKALACLSLW
ncbi:hypothetical protein B0H14DRAFT_2563983 [Mycena olivaceomarginata]|nr:hypothetical protein B0H14DRAFT_2563983 [Mycena olivaceomarginata]